MKKGFLSIDWWMFGLLGLSGNEILVFALIYSYCVNGKGIFYGSISRLAERVNLSRRSVSGIISRLVGKGLICRETVGEYDGYVICIDPETYQDVEQINCGGRDVDNSRPTVDNFAKGRAQHGAGTENTASRGKIKCEETSRTCEKNSRSCEENSYGSGKNLPTYKKHIYKTENRINNKENWDELSASYPAESETGKLAGCGGSENHGVKPSEEGMRAEFEQLWQLYPQARRRGKSKALRAYEISRMGGTPFEKIRRGLDEYVKMIKRESVGERFVKLCVNFFKEEAWLDDFANFRFRLAGEKTTCAEKKPGQINRALDYKQRTYTLEDFKANGISLGEEVYE